MKKIIALCFAVLSCCVHFKAQMSCSNASERALTNYTNGMPNDSLYFICAGQTASLLATPPGGVAGWNFVWQQFNVAGNNWNPLASIVGAPMSEQSNLQPGGYRVVITDGTNTIVGSYVAWVCRINTPPNVHVNTIPAGCGNVQLTGQVNGGSITPYYNPPSLITDPNNALIVNSTTVVNVCFTGLHTWISDLGFYLVGPASCGSPVILLSPNPGSNGQGTICNSANNFTNLCFSNQSTAIFNPCTPGTYSGTYGGYGPGAGTMINWTALNGCDASQAGWSVQVYDCIGGDVGSLTGASINLTGNSIGGSPITYSYSSPSGFSSPIADNSCTPTTASIFTVPSSPAVAITFPVSYQWTSNPPFVISNSTTSLNINLTPGPIVDTQFTLSLTGLTPSGACGAITSYSQLFDYTDPVPPTISAPTTAFCTLDLPVDLSSNINGGTWAGNGITNSLNGTFNASSAGVGTHVITYTMPDNCIPQASITLNVSQEAIVNITAISPMCNNADPITLSVTPTGGVWSGPGIVDGNAGTFNPSLAEIGINTITYSIDGNCPAQGETDVNVTQFIQPLIDVPSIVCVNETNVSLNATPNGGIWSGAGVANSSEFNPSSAGIGSHTLTYTVPGYCEQVASSIIEVTGTTIVEIQPVTALCSNSTPVNLTASVPGGQWNGNGITDTGIGLFDPSIAGSGTHIITYVVDGICQAIGSTVISVYEFVQPVIAPPSPLCINDNAIAINATPLGGTWSGEGMSENGTFSPSAAGVGSTSVIYTVGGFCSANASVDIIVNDIPNVIAGNDVSICEGAFATLSASGAQSYSWSPSAGLSNSQVASPIASPSTSTTYVITGTTNGCSAMDEIIVTVNPTPTVIVNGPFVICQGDTVQLSMAGLSNFSWTNTSSLSQSLTAQPFAFPSASISYTVYGTDAVGCEGSATIEIQVINVNFIFSPEGGIAPLEVEFTNLSQGNSFFWDFGNGDTQLTSTSNEVVNTIYNSEGYYLVSLTTTSGGVQCSETQNILVYSNSEILLTPNIVTADGSGENDNFAILSLGLKTLDVHIFDRWGKKVGVITTPNGSWNPRDYPDGTYFFTLKAEGLDGKTFSNGGSFLVVH